MRKVQTTQIRGGADGGKDIFSYDAGGEKGEASTPAPLELRMRLE